jgi:hypothetical protein
MNVVFMASRRYGHRDLCDLLGGEQLGLLYDE